MNFRWLLPLLASAPFADAESDLAALMARIEGTADSSRGMNEAEQKLAEEIASHKTAAADQLIPLLSSEDEDVRQLAGYCLCELPAGSLLDRHLTALTDACRKERDWLPNAIADIDADAAVEFLAADFRRKPETHAQIDNALVRTAPRSVPHLLKEFGQSTEAEEEFRRELWSLWMEMGEKAAEAVKPLLEISLDESLPEFRRRDAISYLGAIGPAAKDSLPALKQAVASQPEWFGLAVSAAILGSRTSEAASGLLLEAVKDARSEGTLYEFRSLAELGKEAGGVGESLVELLDDPDRNVRLGACRALGYVDRLDLWPQLARALKDPDWRVSFCACLGLANLKAKGALPSLKLLKETHWYPRVRHTADLAITTIEGIAPSEDQKRWVGYGFRDEPLPADGFFIMDMGCPQLAELSDGEVEKLGIKKTSDIRWNVEFAGEEEISTAKTLYPAEYEAISTAVGDRSGGAWDSAGELTGRMERDGETLIAISAGEWGGGVFAVSSDKKVTAVLGGNVDSLVDWDGRLMSVSGIAHMGMDEGMVHEVVHEQGRWRARALYALPGCPLDSGVLADGRLFVNCNGGAVAIGKDGDFEFLGSEKSSGKE